MMAAGSRSGLRRSSKTAFTMRTFISRPSARVPRLVNSFVDAPRLSSQRYASARRDGVRVGQAQKTVVVVVGGSCRLLWQGGCECGEAESDRLRGSRQEASILRVPHVAIGRLAQPGGLRGGRLVVRPERGTTPAVRVRLWRPLLRRRPSGWSRRITVAVQVDRVGDPEDARSPIPRGRLIRPRDGPVRSRDPRPRGDRHQGDVVGRAAEASRRLSPSRRAAKDRSGRLGP